MEAEIQPLLPKSLPEQNDNDSSWSLWEWISTPSQGKPIKFQNSPAATCVLLLNAMIGSGILVQPYVFRMSGIISTCIEYAIIGTMTYCGIYILGASAQKSEIFNYAQLSAFAFGSSHGEMYIDISIVIGNGGALLSYMLIVGSLSATMIADWTECSYAICSAPTLTALLICAFVLPVCLIRHYAHLAMISIISIIAISGTVLLVLIDGPIQSSQYTTDTLNMGSLSGSLQTIGSIIFAFGYANAVFWSYNGLSSKDRNMKVFGVVTFIATLTGVLMCFAIGLVGYLSFRSDTQTNILLNFTGTLGTVCQAAVVIHLLLYIPGDFVIMRCSLMNLFGIDVMTLSDCWYFAITIFTLGLTLVTACLLQQYMSATTNTLAIVLDLTGGVAFSFISFVIPGMIGIRVLSDDSVLLNFSTALACFGLCVPVLVIVSTILTYS